MQITFPLPTSTPSASQYKPPNPTTPCLYKEPDIQYFLILTSPLSHHLRYVLVGSLYRSTRESVFLFSLPRYARQTFWITIVASITVDRLKKTVLHSWANRSSTHRRRKLLRKSRFRYARCVDDAAQLSLDPARSRVHRKANAATTSPPEDRC